MWEDWIGMGQVMHVGGLDWNGTGHVGGLD